MTGHPRRDGKFTFYQILTQYKKDPRNKWGRYNYGDMIDRYDFPNTVGFENQVTMQPSGDVWQRCGIHGTEELEYARIVLRRMRNEYPDHNHKIVRRTVTMKTEDIDT